MRGRDSILLVATLVFTLTNIAAAPAPAKGPSTATAATPVQAGSHSPNPSHSAPTAAPHVVDVRKLPAYDRSGKKPAAHLPLFVRDRSAYATAKKSPKGRPGRAITKGPARSTAGAMQISTSSPFTVSFPGITSGCCEPPDTQMAVGPTRVLEMVNDEMQVYNKSGLPVGSPFSLEDFFGFSFFAHYFPTQDEVLDSSDPRVLYDSSTGRWYASVMGFNIANGESGTFLGISDTNDPGGNWVIHWIDLETGGFLCDQPKLGYSSDKFVIGCTMLDSTDSFVGATIIVATKSQGLARASMDIDFYNPDITLFDLVPTQNLGSGAAAYIVFNRSNGGNPGGVAAVGLLSLTATPSNVGGSHYVGFSVPMQGTTFPPNAPQLDSTDELDTGNDRFMSAVVQGGVIYTTGGEGCTLDGDSTVRACLRLVEIGLAGPTLIQGATWGLNGRYLLFPTLGLNSTNDVVVDYSTSSATEYPGLEVAVQPAGDPNTFVGGGVLASGTGPYVSTVHAPFTGLRWGDYGAAAVDPIDPSKIWVAGELSNGPATGLSGTLWGTQIGELSGRIPSVCTVSSLTPNPLSPQGPGTSIVLTGAVTCALGATPEYSFWIKPPGGVLAMVQAYGGGNTYTWTGQVTLGTWTLELRTRATVETSRAFDSLLDIPYVITATPCTVPTLVANPAGSPQVAGTPVTLTANTTCGAPPPLYQFWIKTPDLVWHMVQAYSASNVYNWTTLDTQIGNYVLEVQVKNTGSLGAYDNYTSIPYSMQLCTAPTLSASPASSPYASGAGAITLTATGTCAGGTQYEFFYKDTSAVWHLIRGYGSSNTATWNADYKPGIYTLQVQLRPVGSTASAVTFKAIPFTLTGCGLPGLVPSPAGPQVAGTPVNWTANVLCSGTPQYQFYVKSPAGVWTLKRPWGASNLFAWSSPTTAGTYTIQVWVRNAGANEDAFDNYKSVTYSLVLCSAPTLSTGAASSPYASGAGAITLTATGTCAGGQQYEFFYKDPAAVWHLIRGYGSSNTATWNADYKPGIYTLQAQLRPVGSTASAVTFKAIPFTLTGCGVPTLVPNPAGPKPAGTGVNWTATVACTRTPQYQFYVKSPAGVWTLAQPWGASNLFAWSSPTTAGTYTIQVWVRNVGAAEDAFDNYKSVTYTLS